MAKHDTAHASTTEGLPVSPSLAPSLEAAEVPSHVALVDARVAFISLLAIGIAILSVLAAEVLVRLINLITNLAFFGRWSWGYVSPADNHLGWFLVGIPVLGGLVVGLMARYGSEGIRGHGIPEAMEQVLLNQSRMAPRLTFLKPLSAAIAIGTGGPFGAEGPIIATGGALGSLVGQVITTTAAERKTLLAAGAAAGMAAFFGTPVAAVLLAVELLLFEYRPRSLIPVALASVTATAGRMALHGPAPIFAMPALAQPGAVAMAAYVLLGALVGLASVVATRLVYGVEALFGRTHLHWMWWPALGAIAVGVLGVIAPRTLGVGYYNITDMLAARITVRLALAVALWKLISWGVSLGSGTSGGTLAPLFIIGGGLGTGLGAAAAWLLPHAGIDVRLAALVGMAAIFAGASRALLASAVFAFETTLQPMGLLPLLGGCAGAFFISCLLMRYSIMTAKFARRGIRVPAEYSADYLDQILVRDAMSPTLVSLPADQTLQATRTWLTHGTPESRHQGFPVLDTHSHLVGVLTRRDLLESTHPPNRPLIELIKRRPVVVFDDCTLRDAEDQMVDHDVGRLPVLPRAGPLKVLGMLTRSDLLHAQRRRLADLTNPQRGVSTILWRLTTGGPRHPPSGSRR